MQITNKTLKLQLKNFSPVAFVTLTKILKYFVHFQNYFFLKCHFWEYLYFSAI